MREYSDRNTIQLQTGTVQRIATPQLKIQTKQLKQIQYRREKTLQITNNMIIYKYLAPLLPFT